MIICVYIIYIPQYYLYLGHLQNSKCPCELPPTKASKCCLFYAYPIPLGLSKTSKGAFRPQSKPHIGLGLLFVFIFFYLREVGLIIVNLFYNYFLLIIVKYKYAFRKLIYFLIILHTFLFCIKICIILCNNVKSKMKN